MSAKRISEDVLPFRDFCESQTPPSPNHYVTYLDPVLPAIVKDDLNIAYFRFLLETKEPKGKG